jgi:DNA-directed RNA polymerase specialized sigma24 family protein
LRTKKPGPQVTIESFSSFLAWLSPDGDRAGEEYELLRYKLCAYFGNRRCSVPDELADETINRVILKRCEAVIDNKSAYLYGVARNVYREFLRKQPAYLDIDKVVLPSTQPDEPSFSRECLDKCLDELPPQKKELVLQYFSRTKTAKINLRRQISETMEKSQTALRMQVMRIKAGLKRCVQDCMSGEGVT